MDKKPFFQPMPRNVDRKRVSRIRDPLFFSNSKIEGEEAFIILVDSDVNKGVAEKIDKMISRELGRKVTFKIVGVLPFKPTKKETEKEVIRLYSDNRINLRKHIKPNSKVIAVGRSLYSLTRSGDLMTNHFYDFIFNNPYFYCPEFEAHVFPVDQIYAWVPNDTHKSFEHFFAMFQIRMAYESHFRPTRYSELNRIDVSDDVYEFLKNHDHETHVAWDIETTGLDYFYCDIGCVTMSFDGKTGYYFDWDEKYVPAFNHFLRNKYQIGANLKFDVKHMRSVGVSNAKVDFDLWQAGHLCNEMRSQSLKSLAWHYTKYGGYDYELDEYTRKYKSAQSNYMTIPREIRFKYAIDDAILTFQIYKKLLNQMIRIDADYPIDTGWSLIRYFEEIMMPAVNMYVDIEMEGAHVDWNQVKELSKELDEEIEKSRKAIYNHFGITARQLDLNSHPQLGHFLESREWECIERSKDGYYLTNADCLTAWIKSGHEVAKHILDYRTLSTLQDTFVGYERGPKGKPTGIWQYRKPDGKIHSDFLIMVKSSGRNGSKNPNLQNIPKHGDKWAKKIRRVFVPPSDDYYIADVDYAGFQLRIAAIYSSDEVMYEIFTKLSGDIHSITAQAVLKRDVSLEEFIQHKKTKYAEVRFKAKAINFGFLFGSSAFAFTINVLQKEWSKEECIEYIKQNGLQDLPEKLAKLLFNSPDKSSFDSYDECLEFAHFWAVAIDIRKVFFATYPGLQEWAQNTHDFAHENGYVRSPYGAIRRLPQLTVFSPSHRTKDRLDSKIKNLYNISLNSPVQNFEAATITLGMIELHKYMTGMKSRIWGMTHDSCASYIHKDEKEILGKVIQDRFQIERSFYNGIPIVAEGELADYSKDDAWGFGSMYWF